MIEELVPALSTYAKDVDELIILIAFLVGFWYVLCNLVFFFFIVRYRARPGVPTEYVTGEEKELKRWITIPHLLVLVCDIFIIYGAVRVWVDIKQRLPETPYATVRIVGQQWAWSFVHPGVDGKLDTADDIKTVDKLHIEAHKPYIYELVARDVIHSFSIPVFRLKTWGPTENKICKKCLEIASRRAKTFKTSNVLETTENIVVHHSQLAGRKFP